MDYKRRNYFIDKKFQTRFIIRFAVIVLLSSIVIGTSVLYLSRDFTTVAIEDARVIVKNTADFMLPVLAQTILVVTVFSAVAVIILTMYTSHKIAGPLYRIRREIMALKEGNLNANFRTRHDDQLQELAGALLEMTGAMRRRHQDLKAKLLQLKDCARGADKDAVNRAINELEQLLDYYKI